MLHRGLAKGKTPASVAIQRFLIYHQRAARQIEFYGDSPVSRQEKQLLAVLFMGIMLTRSLRGGEVEISTTAIRAAIAKSIPQLEKGAAGSADNRTCFTCHNQALPILSLVAARRRGFPIDEENLKRQLRHTADHLKRGHKSYLEGHGQGGKVLTAGYALWALEAGGWEADEVTAAVTGFLLEYQKDDDHWSHPGRRPPSSGSDFTATYVALRGLDAYGTGEQQQKIESRKEAVHKWLVSERPSETEDRVFRLRALQSVGASPADVQVAVEELIKSQTDDGGWSQKSDMDSDAYATATVLAALLRVDDFTADNPVVRRAIQYLLDTQHADGTWHVVTRAEPFQTYFESGFPHGKDQFISIAGSSWATLALLLTLPETP
jgi:N-acyl-D-amino-acid deacylase